MILIWKAYKMTKKSKDIFFPFEKPPDFGEVKLIKEDIFWARMPLPMMLNHVNVYILNSSEGLTIIDTGINTKECLSAWKRIIKNNFSNKKILQVFITHHHPDHIGLAGWFSTHFNAKIFSSRTSWFMARMLCLDFQKVPDSNVIKFWQEGGMNKDLLEKKTKEKPFNFSDIVYPIPIGFQSKNCGEKMVINGENWMIEIGNGHAPDHLILFNDQKSVIFSGDQIIAGISPNLGVYATEPNLDTVGLWINSCKKFLELFDDNFLVLPGHKLPFFGVKSRLKQLIFHHEEILMRMKEKLSKVEFSAADLFQTVFGRDIKESEYILALGETIGHLNFFKSRGLLSWTESREGVRLFSISKGL